MGHGNCNHDVTAAVSIRREDIYWRYKGNCGVPTFVDPLAQRPGLLLARGLVQRASNEAILTFFEGENIVSPHLNRRVCDGFMTALFHTAA
jgi:hypothetical protein